VTIGVTVHDKRSNLRKKGAGDGQLRHELRARFGTICCQEGINDLEVGGIFDFKFKRCYKIPRDSLGATLGCVRIEQLQSSEHCVLLPPLTINMIMTARIRVRLAKVTAEPHMAHEERAEVATVPEVPKSP